jgi:electron transfer flavoprotein beta subunit
MMGPPRAETSLRKALAMGAARAVHVVDAGLVGADLTLTADVLARAVARVEADLVICGNASTDGAAGVVSAMMAEQLRFPLAGNLTAASIEDDRVTGTRQVDGASQRVRVPLPAVISVTEQAPDARFPNFKGIMAAKKKPIDMLGLADLGIDPLEHSTARSIVLTVAARPPRGAGVKVVDDGSAADLLAEFLVGQGLI